MFQSILKKHYGIEAVDSGTVGHYHTCLKEKQRYLLVPVGKMEEEVLSEMEQIAAVLVQKGDQHVSTFLQTLDKKKIIEVEEEKYCVLTCNVIQQRKIKSIGRKLAKFHYHGRSIPFPVKKLSRIGQWKQLWETRIDQIEKVWRNMLVEAPDSEFDVMFIESFPYYMAIAENAMQYLVDTELDDEPKLSDFGTVCHNRFTSNTWREELFLKNPFDWVFDHRSRDLAEWTRERYLNNYRTYQPEVASFYKDYQSIERLSSFSWRLLYARLLFPLHYVECIENYYSTTSEQDHRLLTEHLEKYLHQSAEYEKFLKYYYEMVEVPVVTNNIPLVDWL